MSPAGLLPARRYLSPHLVRLARCRRLWVTTPVDRGRAPALSDVGLGCEQNVR